ncbi:MAG: hypothetical protein E7473_02740 [Ruminococcaceae bacterium]|nr:hypothetical protein [Oscillospiraceae bacterium]
MEFCIMKFSIFSDLHYAPGVFDGGTYEDLNFIYKRAKKEGSSFIIHAGDFAHGGDVYAPDDDYENFINTYNNLDIPTYHCLGNHDTDNVPLEKVLELYKMPDVHYFFDCEGYRFIIYDPNYCLIDGEYVHYDMGNYFKTPEARDWLPPSQIEWMRKAIEEANCPCVLISHASLERPDGIKNRQDVLDMINEQNKKRPHAVLMVINGHYHRDNIRILDGVLHFDLNSASFDWIGKPYNGYPKELCEKIRLLPNTIVYNDPIHAVITLEGTTITIEGMKSSTFMGVGREMTENPYYDEAGRPVTAEVQSAKITLH